MLSGFWHDQQMAVTYPELREVVMQGYVTPQMVEEWRQDYSVLISDKFSSVWERAIEAGSHGQPILDDKAFEFNFIDPGVQNWITTRGSEFVTLCTDEQKQAISTMLLHGMENNMSVDEVATNIRACIGLTKSDATSVMNYYNRMKDTLRQEHPQMWQSTIETKAKIGAQRYAERCHRQRAMMIAQTEMAFAYNQGADFSMRQAYEEGLVGTYKKVWTTSGDDAVCAHCDALDGVSVGMDGNFGFGKGLFEAEGELPPAHPRCACAIEYVEIEAPDLDGAPRVEEMDIEPDLTEDEQGALIRYVSPDSYKFNYNYRTDGYEGLSDREKALADNLESAMAKLPKVNGLTLNRSLHFSNDKQFEMCYDKYEIGKKTKAGQFLSTTKKGIYDEDGQAQIFIMNAQNGRDMMKYGAMENEVLYSPDQEFITRRKFKSGGKHIIIMEEVV